MSAALHLDSPPRCWIPEPVRPLATVTVLRPPRDLPSAPPVRLTARGVAVLAALIAAVAIALVWVAVASAPATQAAPAHGPAAVTVRAGDTLWSIASRVAPARDPRAEVADLQRINRLHGVALMPGQVLQLR